MTFSTAVEYLFSLGNEVSAMKLGLENIRTLLAELGDPQNKFLKVQVAGTNGKGSVCAFLDSICNRAGISTGLYTSPHLVSITERIRINGLDIADNEFARLADLVRKTSESLLSEKRLEYLPTFFEQVTAIALLAFAEREVELAILETGLGGRLDATTAANAEIAAITQIALDHQEYLGNTIEEIALEKAAIIHPGSKVVAVHQTPEVERVIKGRCRELGIKPVWAGNNFTIKRDPEIAPLLYGTFRTSRAEYPKIDLNEMLGTHQFQNASLAISIAEVLQESGVGITDMDICIGLETARHPGRLEYLGKYLLDGAHNAAGAKALREFLDEFETRPITMIFGAMKDKDVSEMTSILFPRAEHVFLTRADNTRALSTAELHKYVYDPPTVPILETDSLAEAMDRAGKLAGAYGLVLITGSLYLVGEAKKILNN